MSMNKKLMVVGCSFSTGEETCDDELIENYWDFHKDPDFVGAGVVPARQAALAFGVNDLSQQ